MQAILDAIQSGKLNARITCVISDVEGARILERAEQNDIPGHFIDHAPFKTKLDGAAEQQVINTLKNLIPVTKLKNTPAYMDSSSFAST